MKTCIKLSTLIAVCHTILSVAAQAQSSSVPGSETSITFKMTGSMTIEGTAAKDENGKTIKPSVPAYSNEWTTQDKNGNVTEENTEEASGLVKVKISNKEILDMLVSEGVISNISGWGFVMVSPALSPDDDSASAPYFYIVRTGSAPIYVGDYFEVWDYSSAETYKRNTATKYTYDMTGNLTSATYTDSGSYASSTAVYTTFSTENGQVRDEALLQINGIWQESGSIVRFGDKSSTDYRLVPKSTNLTSISGDLSSYDKQTETTSSAVIDGSWAGKGTAVADISTDYPEAAASVTP